MLRIGICDDIREEVEKQEKQVRQITYQIGIRADCIFRKNRALAPHERSAVPLGTDHCPVG